MVNCSCVLNLWGAIGFTQSCLCTVMRQIRILCGCLQICGRLRLSEQYYSLHIHTGVHQWGDMHKEMSVRVCSPLLCSPLPYAHSHIHTHTHTKTHTILFWHCFLTDIVAVILFEMLVTRVALNDTWMSSASGMGANNEMFDSTGHFPKKWPTSISLQSNCCCQNSWNVSTAPAEHLSLTVSSELRLLYSVQNGYKGMHSSFLVWIVQASCHSSPKGEHCMQSKQRRRMLSLQTSTTSKWLSLAFLKMILSQNTNISSKQTWLDVWYGCVLLHMGFRRESLTFVHTLCFWQ